MTRQQRPGIVDEDGVDKAELANAAGDLAHLPTRMRSGIPIVRLQLICRQILN